MSPEAQSVGVEWGESVSLEAQQSLKNLGDEMILCCLEIARNIMAVGSKDGQINVY